MALAEVRPFVRRANLQFIRLAADAEQEFVELAG